MPIVFTYAFIIYSSITYYTLGTTLGSKNKTVNINGTVSNPMEFKVQWRRYIDYQLIKLRKYICNNARSTLKRGGNTIKFIIGRFGLGRRLREDFAEKVTVKI